MTHHMHTYATSTGLPTTRRDRETTRMPGYRGGPSGEEGGDGVVLEKRGQAGGWPAADVVHMSTGACLDPSQKTFFDLCATARTLPIFPSSSKCETKTSGKHRYTGRLHDIAQGSHYSHHPPTHTTRLPISSLNILNAHHTLQSQQYQRAFAGAW